MNPTQAQLEKWCVKWQQKLRLVDWDIKIGLGHVKDFTNADAAGEVTYSFELAKAAILVIHEDEFNTGLPEDLEPYDPEWIVVHELLHLQFAPFWRDKKEQELEKAINVLAFALIKLDREKKPKR